MGAWPSIDEVIRKRKEIVQTLKDSVPTCWEVKGEEEPSCHVCGAMTTNGKCLSCGATFSCT